MTPSELKYQSRDATPHFFNRSAMKFFGDTMKNYGVRSNAIDGIEVWELYRKRPVMHGLQNSHYFRKDNFKTISRGE